MAYQCIRSKRECDGCELCRGGGESGRFCERCGAALLSGSCYYELDGVEICSECIRLARRIA